MKKSRFSSIQIVKILKEFESGKSIQEACGSHGISQGTRYNWRKCYGGMEAGELKTDQGAGSRKCQA